MNAQVEIIQNLFLKHKVIVNSELQPLSLIRWIEIDSCEERKRVLNEVIRIRSIEKGELSIDEIYKAFLEAWIDQKKRSALFNVPDEERFY